MRSSLLVILALSSPAGADGGYFIETVGAARYQGDLERFSPFEARLQLGGGYVRGPWAVEASATIFIPDEQFTTCGTAKCRSLVEPVDLVIGNLDLRRAWRILRPRFTSKIGIDMVLHGGPRWAACQTPRDDYAGPGVGGGATIEMNLRAVSLFFDLGMDLAIMRGAGGDVMNAQLPYAGAGMRIGWF